MGSVTLYLKHHGGGNTGDKEAEESYLFQGHVLKDLASFYLAPLLKGSTTPNSATDWGPSLQHIVSWAHSRAKL
jgi:hypothetical protein